MSTCHAISSCRRAHGVLFISLLFLLLVICTCSDNGAGTAKLEGDWSGRVMIAGKELDVFVRFAIMEKLAAEIDIPAQGAFAIPLSEVTYRYPSLGFELESEPNMIQFKARVAPGKITGTVTQGDSRGTISLERVDSMVRRYANAFREEPAALDTTSGRIAGTLTVPEDKGPFPVALLLGDLGPTDRDGNSIFGDAPSNHMKLLAVSLASAGIASLRYDRRGIGGSIAALTINSSRWFDAFVDDAAGYIDMLKKDTRFFMYGIVARGEGAVVGTLACARTTTDFYITVGAPSRPQSAVMLDRLRNTGDDKTIADAKRVIDSLVAGVTVTIDDQNLLRYFPPAIQPYLIAWFRVNPIAEFAKLDLPILVINGRSDALVDANEAGLLVRSNPKARLALIDGMNHMFMERAKSADVKDDKTEAESKLVISGKLVETIFTFITGEAIAKSLAD